MSAHLLYPLLQHADKSIQQLLSIPSDVAFRISSLNSLEQDVLYPLYQNYLKNHAQNIPILSSEDLKIVQGLEMQGFYITSLDALEIPNTQAFFKAAQAVSLELAEVSKTPLYKGKHTLTATARQILANPEIFFWGASKQLINVVECYLRLPVAYDAFSFYYSVADGRDVGPRKWHRDKEDWRMVKISVYLNDVDETGGPYQIVHPSINHQLARLHKHRCLLHSEVQEAFKRASSDWYSSCIGQARTVLFTDTARFYHRGKPPTAVDRSAVFFSYFSRRPKNPFFCGRSPLTEKQLFSLSQDLPFELRDAVNWRSHLPGVGRYIPKNRLKV
jgi:hypothetical protein